MRLAACFALLALLAGVAALETAVPPGDGTPEAQALPLQRVVPKVRRSAVLRLRTPDARALAFAPRHIIQWCCMAPCVHGPSVAF